MDDFGYLAPLQIGVACGVVVAIVLQLAVLNSSRKQRSGAERARRQARQLEKRIDRLREDVKKAGRSRAVEVPGIAELRESLDSLDDSVAVVRGMVLRNLVATNTAKTPPVKTPDYLPDRHLVKQRNLRMLARAYGLRVLVETGTYMGDMVNAMLPYFDRIASIELSEKYHREAVARFADEPKVELLLGDSGEKLPAVVESLDQPALFWLDGHYSSGDTACAASETPIVKELSAILSTARHEHVIVIDDARDFDGSHDYPTFEELCRLVAELKRGAIVEVINDSIVITTW